MERFEELLNRPAPMNPPDNTMTSEVLEVNCERPDREEMRKAISLLKTGKARGPDEIPAEAIKADLETSIEILYDLIGKIWDTEEIPIGWKEGYLVKIPKKGDLQECRNIMLLSVPGNVLNRIILERLKNEVDNILRDHQAGFRQCSGFSLTCYPIITLPTRFSDRRCNLIDNFICKFSPAIMNSTTNNISDHQPYLLIFIT